MTFQAGIPATGQSLGSSRTQVLGNFTNYLNVISQDHVQPNAGGQGKHNKSTYPVQGSGPVTAPNECALYSKTASGGSQLFLRGQNNDTEIQMSLLGSIGVSAVENGWTFLPGGILLQFGKAQFSLTGSTASVLFITSNRDFPTNLFNVQLTPIGSTVAAAMTVFNQSKTGFDVRRSDNSISNQTYYWTAIGN